MRDRGTRIAVLAAALALALGGCVYAPPPLAYSYPYDYPSYYPAYYRGYYGYPAYYGPPVFGSVFVAGRFRFR